MPGQPHLLVFNCHESWIAQLDGLPYELDILVDLPGRFARGWDVQARPVPRGARLLRAADLAHTATPYDCCIVHSTADLILAKAIESPRLLVLHNTLEGRAAEESASIDAERLRAATRELADRTGTSVVAISDLKAVSWGLDAGEPLLPGIDVEEFGPYLGSQAAGIRVANHVQLRQRILRWDLHREAFHDVPVTLVGHNHGLVGVSPARSFRHLKDLLRVHRFYIHTVEPCLEDGYNLGMLEAMASGLPVVGNPHPTSPIEHGVSGLLSNDPAELRRFANMLLDDPELAARLGAAAREQVRRLFGRAAFVTRFARAVEQAATRAEAWRASCLAEVRSI